MAAENDGTGDRAADPATVSSLAPSHVASETMASESPPAPSTEWTVSDRRGPLSAAETGDGVERIVPGSEIDAEGAYDPPSPPVSTHDVADTKLDSQPRHDHLAEEIAPGAFDRPTPDQSGLSAPLAAPPARGRSLWPVAAGIVLGAIIGAGSAAYIDTQHPNGLGASDGQGLGQLSSRVDALEKRPDQQVDAGLKNQIADLGQRVSALEKARAPAVTSPAARPPATAPAATAPAAPVSSAPVPTATAQPAPSSSDGQAAAVRTGALVAQVAALQVTVDGLQKLGGSQDLTQKFEALQAGINGNQAGTSADRSSIAALKDQQQALGTKITALQDAISGAQKQASAAQSGIDTLQNQQKSLEGKLGAPALGVVADSLVEQIQAGRPFSLQVDALASLNADPAKVAVLRQNAISGVPAAKTLLLKFQPLADPMIATGTKVPAGAGFFARLKYGLFNLVHVRRADETTGSDLTSRIELIKADLARNDVPDAYAIWTALPADAKQKSAAWGALAKISVEAITAARDLQSGAITSLATKRS